MPADFGLPAWYGYSIGRWEGDIFVVETAGFKEGSWLDNSGHPHTDALRMTERFRRVNFGHMEVDVTIDDPKAYSRPWKSHTMRFTLQPDTELLEHLCENNRDLPILERNWRRQEQTGASTKAEKREKLIRSTTPSLGIRRSIVNKEHMRSRACVLSISIHGKSTDGGTTWAIVDLGFRGSAPLLSPIINALAVDPQNSATVHVGTVGNGVLVRH